MSSIEEDGLAARLQVMMEEITMQGKNWGNTWMCGI